MDVLSPSPVLITPYPPFPETTTVMEGGMFLSKPVTSTDLGNKLNSSYITSVDLLKLDGTVSTLEDSRSGIHVQMCVHAQCIYLS